VCPDGCGCQGFFDFPVEHIGKWIAVRILDSPAFSVAKRHPLADLVKKERQKFVF
jgi:hypothetical protein